MVRGFSGAFWELRRKQQPWLRSRLNSACRHLMIWVVSGGQATPQVFLTDPGPHCPQRVMGTLGVPVREVGRGKGTSRPGAPRSGRESLGRPAGDARVGLCVLSQTQTDKQRFLRAVEILSDAVRAQANGSMDEYFPKAVLAKKIETLILEEASELLTSNVRQQAMLCVVALSQVNPPFSLSQKLDLVNVGVVRVFALPHARRSVDEMDSASLYAQTVQAFEDMLQALVMDGLDPDMTILQKVLEVSGCRGQSTGALDWRRRKEGTRGRPGPPGLSPQPAPQIPACPAAGAVGHISQPTRVGGTPCVAVTA
ncbi:uncharacterized protein LOC111744285 isoform X2 [Pteropus vampyrus]|uniref:Uncharacterized protein LOC111744285 isoform X2 n=1 Tax=Pteropus vampyrus TaxID=132908 RepID=A0A6P6CTD1_PTEVA|nr:uncharacterized protein LOC111744285 isoform X2 [Pteropus vampyrus]